MHSTVEEEKTENHKIDELNTFWNDFRQKTDRRIQENSNDAFRFIVEILHTEGARAGTYCFENLVRAKIFG